jgi:hypothetical protein
MGRGIKIVSIARQRVEGQEPVDGEIDTLCEEPEVLDPGDHRLHYCANLLREQSKQFQLDQFPFRFFGSPLTIRTVITHRRQLAEI